VVTSHAFEPPVPQWNGEVQCRFFVGTGKIDTFIFDDYPSWEWGVSLRKRRGGLKNPLLSF